MNTFILKMRLDTIRELYLPRSCRQGKKVKQLSRIHWIQTSILNIYDCIISWDLELLKTHNFLFQCSSHNKMVNIHYLALSQSVGSIQSLHKSIHFEQNGETIPKNNTSAFSSLGNKLIINTCANQIKKSNKIKNEGMLRFIKDSQNNIQPLSNQNLSICTSWSYAIKGTSNDEIILEHINQKPWWRWIEENTNQNMWNHVKMM